MKNKYVNRIVAVVVATVLFLALLPTGIISVFAASSGKCGDNLTWTLDDDGNLTIIGTGVMNDYYNTYQNNVWFTTAPWGSGIKSVTIGNGVTSIGSDAFFGCKKLTSITIPDSVTSIGIDAFTDTGYYNNNSNWKGGVLYIGNCLIKAKSDISGAYTIKSGTTCIADYAFGRTGLTSVTIPDSVTSIGEGVFSTCTGLTSITIPDSVTEIDRYAFYNCTGLKSVKIPNRVTSIGEYAFSGCKKLTSITIPDSVTSIGSDAFSDTGYYNNNSNWENGVLYIGNCLIKAKSDISGAYTIKSGTVSIADDVFYGCIGLTSVTIPNSVMSIGEYAFYGCTSLMSITIPEKVISIGKEAFSSCDSLRRVIIPKDVESIGEKAFYNCTDLTSITISGGPLIGADAFTGTSYYNNVSNWQEYSVLYIGSCLVAFIGGDNIRSYSIPWKTMSIADKAFADAAYIRSVSIPSSVKSIGVDSFEGCANITLDVIEDSYAHRFAKENGIRYALRDIIIGDPDGDGEITVTDAICSLRVAMGIVVLTGNALEAADIDGDLIITVSDALHMLRMAASLPI